MLFSQLCACFEKIQDNPSQIYKINILAELFGKCKTDEIENIVMLCLANVFLSNPEKELGISSNLIAETISKAFCIKKKIIMNEWQKTGDLGITAQNLFFKKTQKMLFSSKISICDVVANLQKFAIIEGKNAQLKKIQIISSLFGSCTGLEAKYLSKIIIGNLRIGISEGIIKEAILTGFFTNILWKNMLLQKRDKKQVFEEIFELKNTNIIIEKKIIDFLKKKKNFDLFKKNNKIKLLEKKEIKDFFYKNSFFKKKNKIDFCISGETEFGNELKNKIEKKIDTSFQATNNLALIAKIAKQEGEFGLNKLDMKLFCPIKVMLAQKAQSFEDAFERVGIPSAIEYKYDGIRMQIHKNKDKIQIYTRKLENITKQFPEIEHAIKKNILCENCVIEGEAVGIDANTKKYIPFQYISQRIKRKYRIKELSEKFPVVLHIFDITYFAGKSMLLEKFSKRRKLLEKIIKQNNALLIAKQLITSSIKDAKEFYKLALKDNQEGVMIKNLNSPYIPGSRVGTMLKLKPILDTLDLVIVGAEYGKGKRKGYLSSFLLACKDEKTGEFKTIGKLGTGLKEKQEQGTTFMDLSNLIKEDILMQTDLSVFVKPKIVVEVAYEEMQKSTNYESGYALRFPRFIQIRPDKDASDINTIKDIELLKKLS